MDQYFAKFGELFHRGDPEMTKWFLFGNNYFPIVLSGLYILISTKVGPAFMRNRKPLDLRNSMVAFNLFLVAVYTVCFLTFLWNVQYFYNDFSFFCERVVVKKGGVIYTIAQITWVLYIMKYVEFLDTIFFVLRKKQNLVSVLHVTHHSTVPLLMWLTARTETVGIQLIPVYLNAFVHIVMYSYYGLAAMGPTVRKHLWWKKYITQLQIMQFFVVIFLGSVVVPLTGCKVGIFTYVTNVCFTPLILYLFYKFYIEAYETSKKSKEVEMNSYKKENGYAFSNNKHE